MTLDKHLTKDTDVHGGSQVINVGDEHIFFAVIQQCLKYARIVEALIHITVAWWIPPVSVSSHA